MKQKFVVALGMYAVMAIVAWHTLEHEKLRNATLLILGLLAVLTYTGYRRHMAAGQDKQER